MGPVYYIGGSTCCGKSSVAERLSERHGLRYYKLDDFLDPFMERLAAGGNLLCQKTNAYSMEEMWMRDPDLLCREEMEIYRDIVPLAQAAIAELPGNAPILAEGAGFLPAEMHRLGIGPARYVCMTPTPAFQRENYSRRPWIGQYLQGCRDPDQAFANWMERDVLFAAAMAEQAGAAGYRHILVDGSVSIEETAALVEGQFQLA